MSYQQDPYDDTWAGLEPIQPQPEGRNWLPWLAAGAAVVLLTCLCLVGGYLVFQQFGNRTSPAPTLAPPPGATVAATLPPDVNLTLPPPTPPVNPTATPAIPATVTLAAAATQAPAATATIAAPVPSAGNVSAVQLPSPPVLDGNLGEWAGVASYQSAFLVYNDPAWNGTADLNAIWRLAWDATFLYVAVEVVDDVHVQTQTGNQIFRGDSVDMQFDTNRANSPDRVSPDNFQFILSPGDFAGLPPSAWRFQGTDDGRVLDAPGGHHVTLATQRTTQGYNLEAAIPWSDLNTSPSPGLVLGLALNANDNDSPGTAVQEVMMSHVPGRTLTNPSTWGTLTLR